MNSIIRKKTTKEFTIIPNGIFHAELSLRAIGLLTYILHLPDDWVLYKNYLYENMPEDGKDAIRSTWEELEKKGFIKSERVAGEKGKLPQTRYFVYDSAQKVADLPDAGSPTPDSPTPGIRMRKNSTLLRTKVLSTNIIPPPAGDVVQAPAKPPKKQRRKRNTPPMDPPVKTLLQEFTDTYDQWYKEGNDGTPPKFDGAAVNALKSIMQYFRAIAKARAEKDGISVDEAEIDRRGLDGWRRVLADWPLLDSFLRGKTRLLDINSNIQNIITAIKNANQSGGAARPGQSINKNGAGTNNLLNRMEANARSTGQGTGYPGG